MKDRVNGTVLAWDEAGTGEAVVLVHGIAESRRAWQHQVGPLAGRFRVIAFDVRGFGESEAGEAESRIEQYADDIAALLARLGVRSASVVGFSMGGVIVQRFALAYPELTRALVVAASSSVVNRRAADYYRERAELAEKDLAAARDASVSDASSCFALSPPEVVEAYRDVRRAAVTNACGLASAARAMSSLLDRPLTPELGALRCPTLVVTGERDVYCPPRGSEMIAGAIPGARLEIAPALGHCLHWEDAARFNALVQEFLGGV